MANGERELEQTVELPKKEIQTLREELSMSQRDKCEKENTPSEDQVMDEYRYTDEEELSRETELILKKSRREKQLPHRNCHNRRRNISNNRTYRKK